MIVSAGGEHLIAAAQHVLPHYLCGHVRVARLGEIAVGGAANEPAFALWIKPSGGLSVWNYRGDWCARRLLCSCPAASSSSSSSSSAWSVLLALSAASALIAAASSVVTVVALAGMALLLIAIALLTAFALLTAVSLATTRLGIVGRLLL
jgi:hypothetical protein